jgi:putative SOS response-associated peptidase YedK
MCGRYVLYSSTDRIAELLGVAEGPLDRPRYNIAPTQQVLVGRAGAQATRELVFLRWGLVPRLATRGAPDYRMINARAETLLERPAFRIAFRSRRCLIPADGFYEWKKGNGSKQPYYIQKTDGQPFCFAGLWEHWEGEEGTVLESCAIITTTANAALAPLHERMPVILAPEDYAAWLDPQGCDPAQLLPLLRPVPPEAVTAYPVSTLVNHPRNDAPQCIASLPDLS